MKREIDYEAFATDAVRQRFWSKVVCVDSPTDTCWHWLGSKNALGYGRFDIQGLVGRRGQRSFRSHRAAWILTYGTIDDSLTLDHLCRNPSCVNPAHLEQVTQRVNTLRGTSVSAINALKMHCPQGHPYSESNTRLSTTGHRHCRQCNRDRSSRRKKLYWAARRAQRDAT